MINNDEKCLTVNAKEASELLGCKMTQAYIVIHRLNEELAAQGKIIIKGRTSKKYFLDRTGLNEVGKNQPIQKPN